MADTFDWLQPSLLWTMDKLDIANGRFFQPALFGYTRDTFMDDFLAATAKTTGKILDAARLPETATPHLYQPAHGCFYLVCGSLCCREAGFPDRIVQAGEEESVYFLLRKTRGTTEYAWIPDTPGKGAWKIVKDQHHPEDNEQRLPLSRVMAGNKRPLYVGYLPVSSGDSYSIAADNLGLTDTEKTAVGDPRIQELGSRFTAIVADGPPPLPADPSQRTIVTAIQDDAIAKQVSVYAVLDMYQYLHKNLPDVATAVKEDKAPSTFREPKASEKKTLYEALGTLPGPNGSNLRDLLKQVATDEALPNGWDEDSQAVKYGTTYDFKHSPMSYVNANNLKSAVEEALDEDGSVFPVGKFTAEEEVKYQVRLVYERPLCPPDRQFWVSRPSVKFTIASFFEAGAPTRPVKITLPTDTSPAALRKMSKNVSFQMSNAMRQNMNRVAGKDQFPLHPADPVSNDLAFVCSFSIQIVFIVAFFLLLIFAYILNIIFWWMAFFEICLPIPKKLLPK